MADKQDAYLVLARKYRPENFSTFIGQDAMLQTLKNAFSSNRIAHAFMLTGVRGVGKTTTARILARALNFEDDSGPHPSLDLEVDGKHCRAIIESRHVDVIEMDAASHTGIDDIREIIDSVRYGPVSAPYKVFIIDEVHMLPKAAFNGLLKTLEEPPPYVKFIFATTEIRKVPITILSRCQRFDLRRYDPETLQTYLGSILEKEGITFEPEALQLVIRAGEGSARDNLSLLDQAIAHSGGDIKADTVRQMLGLADRSLTLDLFETLMKGDAAGALEQLRHQYDAGADAATVVTDLAATTHLVTRLKVVPAAEKDPVLTPDEKSRGKEMAQKLNIRVLSRTWQILNKGIAEINNAHDAIQAAEMVLIRLAYAADLPDVNGFSLGGGWYAVALGPYNADDAETVLRGYRNEGRIPRDSFIAYSPAFRQQFWPVGANLLNVVPLAPALSAEQADDIVECYENFGFVQDDRSFIADWTTLTMRKKRPSQGHV